MRVLKVATLRQMIKDGICEISSGEIVPGKHVWVRYYGEGHRPAKLVRISEKK